jgi:hypothetical protein
MRRLILRAWFNYAFAGLLMLAGLVLLAWVDWRLALGLLLFQWGVNIERSAKPWLRSLSLFKKLKSPGDASNG